MDIQIDRLYELRDDLFESLIGDRTITPNYDEVYTSKRVITGIEEDVFILRPKTFYEMSLSHIPSDYVHVELSPSILISGVVATFSRETKSIYLYNCSNNTICIQKDCVVGEAYDR